ncbi:MAG: hypothetical protein NZ853_03370 [Leptospiraceae bacterium]|nr:hypothetical protein [Leptospiraceae bacterium]MDW7975213.1 hypothetical protein [Leptospiraceae bacterium]
MLEKNPSLSKPLTAEEKEKYFRRIENFVFILYEILIKPRTFFLYFKQYLQFVVRKKLTFAFFSLFYFVVSLIFLIAFVLFSLVALFFFFEQRFRNPILSSFLVAWISFLIFFVFLYISNFYLTRLKDVSSYEDTEKSI